MSFLKRGDFKNILFNTSIASLIVYESNPKEYLETTDWLRSANHNIDEICFSHSHKDLEHFSDLHTVNYLMINDKVNKKLYVSFRGTKNISDILVDAQIYPIISNSNGRFHTGFFKRAENVPLGYFIKKLVTEEYELIFTGHSFGAAIAAMITIKLLYMLDMTDKYADKIMFIGYGCPSISDVFFKDNVDQKYKNNFVFIKNENDIVVEILEYISYLIYNRKTDEEDKLDKICGFASQILDNLNVANKNISIQTICEHMKLVIGPLSKLVIPKYTHFGTLLKLKNDGSLNSVNNFEFDDKSFRIMFDDPGSLINKVQNHYCENYFTNLKHIFFQKFIDLSNRYRNVSINLNQELFIDINEKNCEILKHLVINKMRDKSDVILILKNTIKNIEYLVAAKLNLWTINDTIYKTIFYKEKLTDPLNDGSIYFKFNCLNQDIYDENGITKFKKVTFEFYSHFQDIPKVIEIDDFEIKKGAYHKQKMIENMPFDIMILHAAYYVQALDRMNIKDKNENFVQVKNDLLEIFNSLDMILKEIWNEKKSNDTSYNDNDINQIKSLARNYNDFLKITSESDINSIMKLFDNVVFENQLIGFKKSIENAKKMEKENQENGNEILLRSIVPYFYELKKRTCQITSLSEKLKLKILNFSKLGKGLMIMFKDISYFGGVTANIIKADKKFSQSIPSSVSAIPVCMVGGAEATISTIAFIENAISKKCLPNMDFDQVYMSIIKNARNIENNNIDNDTMSFFEKSYNDKFIDEWPVEKDKLIFKLVVLNGQIRDILNKYHIFGAVGTRNAGKSTFVGLVTNQSTEAGIEKITTLTSAYSIFTDEKALNENYKDVIIFDYPHCNSNELGEKLEFYFTRMLLDYVYLIFEFKNVFTTIEEKNLYDLVRSNNFLGLTFLFNQCDLTLKNLKRTQRENDRVKASFEEMKNQLWQRLEPEKSKRIETSRLVLFTSMEEKEFLNGLIELMNNNGILEIDELKYTIFGGIDSIKNEKTLSKNSI